jgi:hypothetical protein
LDHLDERVGGHVPLELGGKYEAGVVVHHGDQVVVAQAHNLEVGGVCSPHLVRAGGLAVVLFGGFELHLG